MKTVAMGSILMTVLLLGACGPAAQQPTPAASVEPTAADSAGFTPSPDGSAPTRTPDARPTVPAPTDEERPLAELSPAERQDRFSGPAETWVKPDTVYEATIVTDKGNIVAELYRDTPESLNNFVTLALNGYYDGLTFHRVEAGFVVQGGDPAGDGSGGPGYTLPAEIVHNHPRGALAWARTGDEFNPDRRSSGSQFYITLDATSFLDNQYTVFGYVVEGMDVADQIAIGDGIVRIDVAERTASRLPTPTPSPTPYAPAAQEGRPLATVAVAAREGLFNRPPEQTLDATKSYRATLDTDRGRIVIDLDAATAPVTVNNFVLLADLGYYDGMPVAFVQADAYAVFGSPGGQPGSDVGYALEPEESALAGAVVTGTVAMYPVMAASGDRLPSGSQFFISFAAVPEGAAPLAVFGTVVEGLDVALELTAEDVVKTITISTR